MAVSVSVLVNYDFLTTATPPCPTNSCGGKRESPRRKGLRRWFPAIKLGRSLVVDSPKGPAARWAAASSSHLLGACTHMAVLSPI